MKELKSLLTENSEFINGYKVIDFADKEKAIVLEGEYYKIIPLKKDLKKVYLEITTTCNFNCITCIRSTWDEKLGHMDMNLFERLIMSLRELPKLETIHLGGFGEPLNHPHIFNIIEELKKLGKKVELITNGSLLNLETSQKLVSLGIDYIYVSIDSTVAQHYTAVRKGGNLNDIISNLQFLNNLRTKQCPYYPKLGIAFVAMKSNIKDLSNLMKLANKLKVDKVSISNVLPYNENMVKETLYDMEDSTFPFGIDVVHATIANMRLRSYRKCKFIEQKSVSINWLGEVVPCYSLLHSHKCYIYGREKKIKKYSFGNIDNQTLADIWTNPDFVTFRNRVQEIQFPTCTDCKWLEGCSYTDDNEADCWGNEPSCADCLWYKEIIICP